MDIKGEYVPIKRDIKLVDDDTLKFIDSKNFKAVRRVSSDFNRRLYKRPIRSVLPKNIGAINHFYITGIYKSVIWKSKNYGNKIAFYSKELMFMSVSQKLEMVRVLGDSGSLYENEKRIAFGLRPLPELAGVRKQSLNYVDVEIANQYQLQNQKQKGGKDNEGTGNTQV